MLNNLDIGNQIIAGLIQRGVREFIISPGSRSTPLTVAAARHPEAHKTVHFDERGAAFYALGYAKASGNPAVLICTSGTAVANYFPAIVEASMDNIPLIVLTADRPPELIGVGANQAIFQENIFGDYPRLFLNLPPVSEKTTRKEVQSRVEQLISTSLGERPGPVHMNCQFREPLLPEISHRIQKTDTEDILRTDHEHNDPQPDTLKEDVASIRGALERSRKGMIIVGRSVKERDASDILQLAGQFELPVFADVQSALRFKAHPLVINYFDLALLKSELQEEKPDLILHFGGPFTSKRLLQYIDIPDVAYLSIKRTPERIDPNHQVTTRIVGDIRSLCRGMKSGSASMDGTWLKIWQEANHQIAQFVVKELSNEAEISEPQISFQLSNLIPPHHALILGNSMPIREMEMFGSVGKFKGLTFVNRGSSGIDGMIATAAGVAHGRQGPVTLLVGDLSFLHDLNSLLLVNRGKQAVILVVINNGGGGIFNFLPVRSEEDVFETFFGTPHHLSLKHAAEMFSIPYSNPADRTSLDSCYREAVRSGDSALIEIHTDRAENHHHHQEIFKRIRESR